MRFSKITLSVLLSLAATSARADVGWTSWTAASAGNPGSATGSITFPDTTKVTVNYTGEVLSAQTNNVGTYYWNPNSTYTSASVPNKPATSDVITLIGGNATVNTISFSQSVHNPLMNILSLGDPNRPIYYAFNTPFVILSFGPGTIFGGPGTLTAQPGNRLLGTEGNGTIEFVGDYTSISWTVPLPENYHGFTVGAFGLTPAAVTPEPGSVALLIGLTTTGAGFLARRRKQARSIA